MNIDIQPHGRRWLSHVTPETHLVIVDVLRATSSIVTAFHYGARCIYPVRNLYQAFRKRRYDPRMLLCGERFGVRVPGFDFGNSPTELATHELRGREIIFTSTNGSKVFVKVPLESCGFILSFLNMDGVAQVLQQEGKDVLIICAGSRGDDSEEDWLAAGMLLSLLAPQAALSFMAEATLDFFRKHTQDLIEFFENSPHGQRLKRMGFEEDLKLCATRNIMKEVPVLFRRRIQLWS